MLRMPVKFMLVRQWQQDAKDAMAESVTLVPGLCKHHTTRGQGHACVYWEPTGLRVDLKWGYIRRMLVQTMTSGSTPTPSLLTR